MNGRILYCGDTNLETAAAYLAGVMHHAGRKFDYVPSDVPLGDSQLATSRPLFILSDYPAANLSAALQERIVGQVQQGAGLLMIGGWESFHGLGGNWDGTPVGNILPVAIDSTDDRRNCDHPVLLAKTADHPVAEGLPWDSRPPVIGGFNRVKAKPDATVVLEAWHFAATRTDSSFQFEASGTDPLLVFGSHGRGRVAALMTDVAPHWVGPLVDWGDNRVSACAPGAEDIEVGDL